MLHNISKLSLRYNIFILIVINQQQLPPHYGTAVAVPVSTKYEPCFVIVFRTLSEVRWQHTFSVKF